MEEILISINELFSTIFKHSQQYLDAIGHGVNNVPEVIRNAISNKIPQLLHHLINSDEYCISGRYGFGLTARTPWVAIMNTSETNTPQKGVYLVFLFSSDLKRVFIVLDQGVTGERNGHSLNAHELKSSSEELRRKLDIPSKFFDAENKLDVARKEFVDGAIAYAEWDIEKDNSELLIKFMDLYVKYLNLTHPGETFTNPLPPEPGNRFDVSCFIHDVEQTNLIYDDSLLKRYVLSLLTKPFVILSGLAGSGKTQLALAFAKWIVADAKEQIAFVPVGADWTNREALLGYPNGLNNNEYIKPDNKTLDLILNANAHPELPYFLILDEMNLSYVERYFSDFLSAMEAHEEISLWHGAPGSDIPETVSLPSNLFIVGTINVDETTYMFSPKVLDRANVIEFKISSGQMENFLNRNAAGNMKIDSRGSGQASEFVKMASKDPDQLSVTESDKLARMLLANFDELKKVNAEFGFRSAREIYRFVALGKQTQFGMSEEKLFDFAIVQKLLPKLHGSRKKVEATLRALWKICVKDGTNHPLDSNTEMPEKDNCIYPESADKIYRMYRCAVENGFTSYAES